VETSALKAELSEFGVQRASWRLFLKMLSKANEDGRLNFFGDYARLSDKAAFKAYLKPLRKAEWVVYGKEPFGGPETVLAYLARDTHRVAISNHRLIRADANTVTFKVKDYRFEGRERYKTMTLGTGEFMRRFLMHVLPKGQHRIRHYGLFANGDRANNLAKMRALLDVAEPEGDDSKIGEADPQDADTLDQPCPRCGGRMRIIEVFEAGCQPRHVVMPEGIDSS